MLRPTLLRAGARAALAPLRALAASPDGAGAPSRTSPASAYPTATWPPPPPDGVTPPAKLVVPPPPTVTDDAPPWAGTAWASPLDVRRRVFCNRSLNMASVSAVGFDMDYTLAQYKPDTFEMLAYSLTVDKLVNVFGYPPVLRDFEFDWRYMARGLVIDKARGNILKVDRHKYVKLAYHGFAELPRETRLATYARPSEVVDFDEPRYALIDTLFSLAEAHLFMQLVELADAAPDALPPGKAYADLYRDVRAAVDLCHRDGSLKSAVAAAPAKYIHDDPALPALLRTLRASGRKLFLATNSLYDYTDVVMRHLLGGGKDRDGAPAWLSYFDAVVTGCGKPAFFTERRPLFEVDPATGWLRNADSGTPMVPIGDADLPRGGALASSAAAPPPPASRGRRRPPAPVFQGGTVTDLHRVLGVASGAEVLYVGDHIYGDILRSKKTLGWRTMLVVPELHAELDVLARTGDTAAELRALRAARDALEDQIQRLEWARAHGAAASGSDDEGDSDASCESVLASLVAQRDAAREKHRSLLRAHHARFHAVWGRLLKTGYQNSRYAHQIERFACLYTSHVSNLAAYSPDKSWRAAPDAMAHEEDPQLGGGAGMVHGSG
jgi:hypothetical protein